MIRKMPGARWTVPPEAAGTRLDRFLAAAGHLETRARAAAALERGKVFVNEVEAGPREGSRRLAAGDVVRVWMDRPGSAQVRVRRARPRPGEPHIVYEDASLLVIDKPAGLLTVPLPGSDHDSLADWLARHLRGHRTRTPLVVHRIDRDTTGLVVFAKTLVAQRTLKEQFARREPVRVYLAVVHGHPHPPSGTWGDLLVWNARALRQEVAATHSPNASEAITQYRVLAVLRDAALLELQLVTGKRNQIRVQAARRGHPLVGERKYRDETERALIPFRRQALHAWRLGFAHPADGRALQFEAPVPNDLRDLIEALQVAQAPLARDSL